MGGKIKIFALGVAFISQSQYKLKETK